MVYIELINLKKQIRVNKYTSVYLLTFHMTYIFYISHFRLTSL